MVYLYYFDEKLKINIFVCFLLLLEICMLAEYLLCKGGYFSQYRPGKRLLVIYPLMVCLYEEVMFCIPNFSVIDGQICLLHCIEVFYIHLWFYGCSWQAYDYPACISTLYIISNRGYMAFSFFHIREFVQSIDHRMLLLLVGYVNHDGNFIFCKRKDHQKSIQIYNSGVMIVNQRYFAC